MHIGWCTSVDEHKTSLNFKIKNFSKIYNINEKNSGDFSGNLKKQQQVWLIFSNLLFLNLGKLKIKRYQRLFRKNLKPRMNQYRIR